jgi:hypothetical protein
VGESGKSMKALELAAAENVVLTQNRHDAYLGVLSVTLVAVEKVRDRNVVLAAIIMPSSFSSHLS